MVKTIPADPFMYDRLYCEEKYTLSNMELKSVFFPDEVDEGKITSVWSDRLSLWYELTQSLESEQCGDAFWNGVPNDQFMTFVAGIAKHVGFPHEVTGARIVRFTDAGAYPVYRLDIASGGRMLSNQYRIEQFIDDYSWGEF